MWTLKPNFWEWKFPRQSNSEGLVKKEKKTDHYQGKTAWGIEKFPNLLDHKNCNTSTNK